MADLTVRRRMEGRVAVLEVQGTVDLSSIAAFGEEIDKALAQKPQSILFHLAGVKYVASLGWGTILAKAKVVRAAGGEAALCSLSPEVRHVYDLLDLKRSLRAYPDEATALMMFGQKKADPAPAQI